MSRTKSKSALVTSSCSYYFFFAVLLITNISERGKEKIMSGKYQSRSEQKNFISKMKSLKPSSTADELEGKQKRNCSFCLDFRDFPKVFHEIIQGLG